VVSDTSQDETDAISTLVKQVEDARAQWEGERNAPPIPCQLAPKSILQSQVEESRMEGMTSISKEAKIYQTTMGHDTDFSISVLNRLSPSMSSYNIMYSLHSHSDAPTVLLRKMRARHIHKVRNGSRLSATLLMFLLGPLFPLPGHFKVSYIFLVLKNYTLYNHCICRT
jgi:hypothetical protein